MEKEQSDKYAEFVKLFNERKFNESAEPLRYLITNLKDRNQLFFQTIIEAVRVISLQYADNYRDAAEEFPAVRKKLEKFRSKFLRLDVNKFIHDMDLYIRIPNTVFPPQPPTIKLELLKRAIVPDASRENVYRDMTTKRPSIDESDMMHDSV